MATGVEDHITPQGDSSQWLRMSIPPLWLILGGGRLEPVCGEDLRRAQMHVAVRRFRATDRFVLFVSRRLSHL